MVYVGRLFAFQAIRIPPSQLRSPSLIGFSAPYICRLPKRSQGDFGTVESGEYEEQHLCWMLRAACCLRLNAKLCPWPLLTTERGRYACHPRALLERFSHCTHCFAPLSVRHGPVQYSAPSRMPWASARDPAAHCGSCSPLLRSCRHNGFRQVEISGLQVMPFDI